MQELYGNSRFNDDDDFDVEPEKQQQQLVEDANDDSKVKSKKKRGPTLTPKSTAVVQEEIDEELQEDNGEEEDEQGSVVKLPPARNVRVKTAEFIKSSVTTEQCPAAIYPEFAVIGRSNVGKSSLINLLTGRKTLAMVSKTPGKTKCINHFLINNAWYMVDLPGYGYARTSKDNVLGWNKFTREYFLERETLVSVLLLIDASIPPMPIDIACANWLGEAEVPYTLVYTKVDKKKKGIPDAAENIAAFEEKLQEKWDDLPSAVATSSRSGAGRNELLSHIARLRSLYNTNKL
jgi:GTP-binding protein